MKRALAGAADRDSTSSDHCYVHSFDDAYRPTALGMPAGRGRELCLAMERLVEESKARLGRVFDSEEFDVHAVSTVDEGLTLLTGRPAGGRGPDGRFAEGSVNAAVEEALEANVKRLRVLRGDRGHAGTA
jgi:hypothetical protein